MNEGLRRLGVYSMNFLQIASAGVVFVFLADLQERFGLSGFQVGSIASAGFLFAFASSIVFAPRVDGGSLVPVAIAAVVSGVVGTLGFAVAGGFWTALVSRALIGVGVGLFGMVARKALLGTDGADGGRAMGELLASGVGGFIAGPVIGALLEPYGFRAPFVVLAGGMVLVALPAVRYLSQAHIATSTVTTRSMIGLLRDGRVRLCVAGQLIVFFNIGVFDALADRFLTDLGATTSIVAGLLLAFGVPMVCLGPVAGRFIDRHNTATIFYIACLATVPVTAAYGFVESLWWFVAVGVCDGLIAAFAFPSVQVYVVDIVGVPRSAIAQTLLEAVGQLGAAMAAFAAPGIYASNGSEAAYGLFAVVGGVAFAAAFAGARRSALRPGRA